MVQPPKITYLLQLAQIHGPEASIWELYFLERERLRDWVELNYDGDWKAFNRKEGSN